MSVIQAFTSSVAFATLPVVMDISWDIGDVIRKLRKRARMNQTTLAAKVGVNKATIVRAEASDVKVSRETYLKIAFVLKTDLARLEAEAVRLQAEQQDEIRQPTVSEGHAHRRAHTASAPQQDGEPLALPRVSRNDEPDSVPSPTKQTRGGRVRASLVSEVRALQPGQTSQPPRARAARKPPAAPRPRAARHRGRDRKTGR
jgi:transcriptional regulator with XRE-family HTH domain